MTTHTHIQNACIITRLGKKAKIFDTLWDLFPKNIHTFVDLFFGSGAMSFGAKAKGVPYVIANDLDDEIFNLYQVINQHKEEFLTQWNNTPISQSLFLHWKNTIENNHILKAVRFVHDFDLNVHEVGNRLNLKNTRKEILITNY